MSLLTCVNNLKGNDYAVDFLQTTITVSLLFGITILLTTNYYGNNLNKKLKFNGWYGCSGGDYSKETWKYFVSRVDSLIGAYSDEETAKIVGCHPDTVSKVVKDIKRSHSNSESHCGSCKPPVKIEQYNEDILVQVFNSVADAAHWCVDNGYAKTAYGYRWEYAQ